MPIISHWTLARVEAISYLVSSKGNTDWGHTAHQLLPRHPLHGEHSPPNLHNFHYEPRHSLYHWHWKINIPICRQLYDGAFTRFVTEEEATQLIQQSACIPYNIRPVLRPLVHILIS